VKHEDRAVEPDGLRVEFDHERVVSHPGVELARRRLGRWGSRCSRSGSCGCGTTWGRELNSAIATPAADDPVRSHLAVASLCCCKFAAT